MISYITKKYLEINEPTIEELQGIINHLFETNTFVINYNDELISLESNSRVSFNNNDILIIVIITLENHFHLIN